MRVLLFGMSPANAHFLIHILWLVVSTKCKIILQSPLVTDLGEWGSMDRCPNGTYVVGMQLKVEQEQPFLHDDSALNGIRLFCVGLRCACSFHKCGKKILAHRNTNINFVMLL